MRLLHETFHRGDFPWGRSESILNYTNYSCIQLNRRNFFLLEYKFREKEVGHCWATKMMDSSRKYLGDFVFCDFWLFCYCCFRGVVCGFFFFFWPCGIWILFLYLEVLHSWEFGWMGRATSHYRHWNITYLISQIPSLLRVADHLSSPSRHALPQTLIWKLVTLVRDFRESTESVAGQEGSNPERGQLTSSVSSVSVWTLLSPLDQFCNILTLKSWTLPGLPCSYGFSFL